MLNESELFGPQRSPAVPGRLRAQWRQVDTENREAREVRQQWMKIIGCDEQEISEAVEASFDLTLCDELDQLAAAIRMSR
jgi:beta-xylosidase